MKKFICLLAVLMLVFVFAACGNKTEESGTGNNPVSEFAGIYQCDRASIEVLPEGSDSAKIVVEWGGSAYSNAEWVMSGKYYSDDKTVEINDCVKTEYEYEENGDIKNQEEVYVGGHAFIKFKEGEPPTLTWEDIQEHVADDMEFVRIK